jgi:hypothetical protein
LVPPFSKIVFTYHYYCRSLLEKHVRNKEVETGKKMAIIVAIENYRKSAATITPVCYAKKMPCVSRTYLKLSYGISYCHILQRRIFSKHLVFGFDVA